MDGRAAFGLVDCGLQNSSFILDKFHGDLYLTVKLLLPGVIKSVYNLNDKQIVKLFSRIFRCNQDEMVRDLEQVGNPSFLNAGHPYSSGIKTLRSSSLGFLRVTCQKLSGCSSRAVNPSLRPPKAF